MQPTRWRIAGVVLGSVEDSVSESEIYAPLTVSDAIVVGFIGIAIFYAVVVPLGLTSPFITTSFRYRELGALAGQVAVALVCTFVAYLLAKRRQAEIWGLIQWDVSIRFVLTYAAAGAGLALMVSLALRLLYGTAGSLHGLLNFVIYMVSAVIVGPLVEEVYFRGLLLPALANQIGALKSILLVTVISAAVHLGYVLYVLPLMAVLGFVRISSKSLLACLIFHACYNLVAALYVLKH